MLKERTKETLFCITIAMIVASLYTFAGAMQRGFVDLPGAAALLILAAPLTIIWISFRTADIDEEKKNE